MWTIEDNKLVSNGDVWQSNHQWNVITIETNPNETMVSIENSLTNKTLVVIENNTTVTEKRNHEGYFFLTYPASNKVLTATNATSLEMKGM